MCVSKQSGPLCCSFALQSLLDDQGLAEVSQVAEQVLDAVNKGLYKEATQLWGKAEMVIEQVTGHTLGGFFPVNKGPLVGVGRIRRCILRRSKNQLVLPYIKTWLMVFLLQHLCLAPMSCSLPPPAPQRLG